MARPRPARNSSKVVSSVAEVGKVFHSWMVLGKKEFL